MKPFEGRSRPMGLRGRIFFAFAAFTLLIVLLLWLFQILLLPYFHRSITRHRVATEAEELFSLSGANALARCAEELSRDHNASIRVYEVNGSVATTVAKIDGRPGAVISLLSKKQLNELFDKAEGEEKGVWFRFQLREDDFRYVGESEGGTYEGQVIEERQVYAILGKSEEGKTYFILMDVPFEPIDGTVRVLSIQLVVLTGALLLLSGLLAYLIASRISRPIMRLNEAAHRLPHGDYPAEYREGGYREVAELSGTLSAASVEIGKVEALQRELIANISHDLRTPLTMISGYAEVMRDIEGENTLENMQVIIDEAARLSAMVGDLVTISRYQGGAESVELSTFSLTEAATSLLEEYRTLLATEGYAFHGELDEDVAVVADHKRIIQVIRNLLDNAVNYSGEQKDITLVLKKAENAVRVEVRDRGDGIPEEDLPNIWQRYYRAGGNHARSRSGSGLGLAIVRENLELHKARYGVESVLGEGSVFWFELPSQA